MKLRAASSDTHKVPTSGNTTKNTEKLTAQSMPTTPHQPGEHVGETGVGVRAVRRETWELREALIHRDSRGLK